MNGYPRGDGLLRSILISGWLLIQVGEASDHRESTKRLWHLIYDFEVASYCAAVSPGAARGFEAATSAELEYLALTTEQLNRLRGKAWQAAHAEWQNRGLRGFKAWCRTEGRAAATRFEERDPRGAAVKRGQW